MQINIQMRVDLDKTNLKKLKKLTNYLLSNDITSCIDAKEEDKSFNESGENLLNEIDKQVGLKSRDETQDHLEVSILSERAAIDLCLNEIMQMWNNFVPKPIPKINGITGKRRTKALKVIKLYNNHDLREILYKACRSDFLTGKTTNYKMNFDFFMNENNLIKISEGNYDNNNSNSKQGKLEELMND